MEKKNLDKLVKEGWLISQTHPELDLTIYNYSQKTQYERFWNEETLSCRGLVMDSYGNIVGRPFKKFFNFGEVSSEIPDLPFEAFEKMDGSLGIFFWYKGNPIFASRGSFTSEQALKGKSMIIEKEYEILSDGVTYLFEIIYEENRIVVDYGNDERLVLLGAIETETGKEIPYKKLEDKLSDKGFELVKKWDSKISIDSILKENDSNREGYVLRFSNGYRIKIKFEEYCRLHRIVTNISNVSIWERIKEDLPLGEILDRVPDEFYDWVKQTEENLRDNYQDILEECEKDLYRIRQDLGNSERREYAEIIKTKKYPSVIFYMLDGKRVNEMIWKLVKPKRIKALREE
jgi:RNA ligase